MVHHARGGANKHWPYLHVRRILWTEDGWPVVSPERYAGEREQDIPAHLISGSWERIVHDPAVDGQISSTPLTIQANGELLGEHGAGQWYFDGQRSLTLLWNDVPAGQGRTEKVQLLPAWDWEEQKQTLVFTGLNDKGLSSWGKRSS
ncbi:Extracellular endo-alpha-(1-_5)-L-arabinanase 2 precursor [compost metagenome]